MGDCEYTIKACGSIVFAENVELDEEDIRFLRSVREVNLNPERYAERGDKKGATPATIERVSRVSNLKDHQIEYRLDAREYVDTGYLELYPVPDTAVDGHGARSFRLTDRGTEIVEIAEREMPLYTSLHDNVSPPNAHDETFPEQSEIDDPVESLLTLRSEVHDLAAQVGDNLSGEREDQLADLVDKVDRGFLMAATELQRSSKRIDSIESDIESLQGQAESEYGMWNDEAIARFEQRGDVQAALRFITHYVLGIDTERLIEKNSGPPYNEQEIPIAKEEYKETLATLFSEKERGDSR